jgi:phosphopentomutase
VNRTGPTPETKAQAELSLRDLLTNNTPGRLAEFFGPDPQFEVTPVTCYAESGYVFQIGAHEGAMTREFLHENGTLAESKITYEEYDYEGSRFVCAWVSPKLTENIQGGWVVYKK